MNETMNEKNRKTIRKMNKYINTFPLDDQAILQIQQDIEGMAQEAQEREEPLEQILGKDPREFCDDLIYAVGGIKTPGGRKMLRIAGAIYQTLGAFGIIAGLIFIADSMTDVFLYFNDFYEPNDAWTYKMIVIPILLSLKNSTIALILGTFYHLAGKRAFQYSSDVSKTNKAMQWAIYMIPLEIIGFIVTLSDIWVIPAYFIIGCIPAIMYIIGARRNRPHTEEAI